MRDGTERQKEQVAVVPGTIDQWEAKKDQLARQLKGGLFGCELDHRLDPGIQYLPEIATVTGMA
jgi:hypothetical protein